MIQRLKSNAEQIEKEHLKIQFGTHSCHLCYNESGKFLDAYLGVKPFF